MSNDPDKQERGRLQHDAEHERPDKKSPVLFYLLILFIAAFLLLLMSFLMQQRANREAIDDLQQTSHSAVESLENKLQENETLKEQVAQLQEQVDDLQTSVDGLTDANSHLEQSLTNTTAALDWFWQIDEAYVRGKYSLCRQLIDSMESQDLVQWLPAESVTDNGRFSPADRYAEIKEAVY